MYKSEMTENEIGHAENVFSRFGERMKNTDHKHYGRRTACIKNEQKPIDTKLPV